MKLPLCLGVAAAVLVHAAVLLFGGIFFLDDEIDHASIQAVDLLSELESREEEADEKEPEVQDPQDADELETPTEEPPDAAEILRNLEAPPTLDSAPALEAASLSAIEAALNGQTGGGDFAETLSLASGGRIGGTGTGALAEDKVEEAFSLAELDQPPRAVYRESPTYPSELRGKKIEGTVSVQFEVDINGKVTKARVAKSSHAAFEAPALSAVKKWKFEPGIRAGQRVLSKLSCSIRFPAN